MMRISGISQGAAQDKTTMLQKQDAESRRIQKEISNVQKKLQELSSNDEMDAEEKMKKRQELQKQITELNNELRQHQIEQRREEQQKKNSSMDELTEKSGETSGKDKNMKAMISADNAMNQAKVQESVATHMEGRAAVLEIEIRIDQGRGGSTEGKEKELAKAEKAVANATTSQAETLGEANQELKEENSVQEKEKEKKESEGTEVKGYTNDGKPIKDQTQPMVSVQL